MSQYSPPKKITLLISLIIEIFGIVIGIAGSLQLIGPFIISVIGPVAFDIDATCIIIGFILTAIAWIVFYIGVKFRGV